MSKRRSKTKHSKGEDKMSKEMTSSGGGSAQLKGYVAPSTKKKCVVATKETHTASRAKEKSDKSKILAAQQKPVEAEKQVEAAPIIAKPTRAKISAEDLKNIISLVTEGNDRISGGEEQAILLLGKTGSGKSTLAHNLAGIDLQGIVDNETGDLVLDAKIPLDTITISHTSISETKIPNKCQAAKKGANVVIWDCPGFSDTNLVQEIANGFYIQKLFKEHKKLKFVLVASEASMTADRGSSFVDVLKQFCATFTDIDKVLDSVSIVVTGSAKTKKQEHIQNKLQRILDQHEELPDSVKTMLKTLKDNVMIFCKPEKEGLYESVDLLSKIYDLDGFTNTEEEKGKIAISKKAQEYCASLLERSNENLIKLFDLLVGASKAPYKALNDDLTNFFEFNYPAIKDWLPDNQTNFGIATAPSHASDENFIHLQQLQALKAKIAQINSDDSFDYYIDIAAKIFTTFEEFITGKEAAKYRETVHKYAYALKQQSSFAEMFRALSSEVIIEDKDLQPKTINNTLKKSLFLISIRIKAAFKDAIINLKIDETINNEQYYLDAIEYLTKYDKEPECIKNLALVYKKIGDIHAEHAPEKAIQAYFASLTYEKDNVTYKVIGDLLQTQNNYKDAIKFYEVIRDSVDIKTCFKELIKASPKSYELREQRGDVHFKLANLSKAAQYYSEAFGLAKDEVQRKVLWGKLIKAQSPETRAEVFKHLLDVQENGNFFDYNALNLDDYKHLAGDEEGS